MATRISMNVSLSPELAKFVRSRVKSGRFQSDSEVIRQGLRLLEEHEAGLDEIRSRMAIGIKQLDQGKGLDGKKVLAELKKRSAGYGKKRR